MNHDASHCSDYAKFTCPPDCYRARLTEDLKNNMDRYKDILISFAHFKGTPYCLLNPGKEKK